MMRLYINNLFSISPQKSDEAGKGFAPLEALDCTTAFACEPPYARHIASGDLRRMSKLVRMGVYAALECCGGRNSVIVDGIIIGNGLGGFERAEVFLESMLKNQERILSPTPFMQSLHSAVAGQIALELKLNGYTMTYAQQAFSFENALMDAQLLFSEKKAQRLLVGGMDEITPIYIRINEELNRVKKSEAVHKSEKGSAAEAVSEIVEVEKSLSKGSVLGEGVNFFLLAGEQQTDSMACIRNIKFMYRPGSAAEVLQALTSASLATWGNKTPDVLLLGNSGDIELDERIRQVERGFPEEAERIYFKNYSGEYPTAVAFATGLATNLIHHKTGTHTALILNQFRDEYYSIILIEKPNSWLASV